MIGKLPNAAIRPTALGVSFQQSTYGAAVPVYYGTTRGSLLLIWAANLRQAAQATKGKGKARRPKDPTSQPNYVENVDFLIGHNPIVTPLSLWFNQAKLELVNTKYSAAITAGSTASVAISDSLFFAVIGVTLSIPYSVTFNDYGAPGLVTQTGTYELPLWNAAYAGPDPTNPTTYQAFPFIYYWLPGSGATVYIENNARGYWPSGATLNIYYAKETKSYTSGPPIGYLSFEPQLGDGPEYGAAYASQQIIYPHYAGIGSANFDMGGGVMSDLRTEILGAYPVYSTGDADFADMIEDIFKQGFSQGSVAHHPEVFTKLQRGLGCFEFPGAVQKKIANSSPVAYDLPNTAGNFLVVLAPGASVISDSAGNTWTQIGSQAGWYATALYAATNTVTVTGSTDIILLEIAGVDTLGSIVTGSGGTANITTANAQDFPAFILAWSQYPAAAPVPNLAQWKNLVVNQSGKGPLNHFAQYRLVRSPGTYSISNAGSPTSTTLISFIATHPPDYPRPLGNIIDSTSLSLCRRQARAYGLIGSMLMDSQKKAADWLADVYEAMDAWPLWSGFSLKSVPRSEASGAGNGALYIAATGSGRLNDFSTFVGPTTAASAVDSGSTPYPWVNPGNAVVEDGATADCALPATSPNAISDSLVWTFPNLGIPSGATIIGVLIEIKRYKDSGTSAIYDGTLVLDNGGILSDNRNSLTPWGTSNAWGSYGGADLWGMTGLTPAAFNAGIKLRLNVAATGAPGLGATAHVDSARITVYYSAAPLPTAAAIPNLSDANNDFIGDASRPLITIERKAQVNAPNIKQIQHPYRLGDYNEVTTSQPETGAIALFGPRKDSPRNMRCIQDVLVARMVLGVMVRREVYLRNTYKFVLQARWKLLEAGDVITLTESELGLASEPVRLTAITENEKYDLDCEAEPFIYGTHAPVPLSTSSYAGFIPPLTAEPGMINAPVIFQPPVRLANVTPPQVWLCLSGSDPNWGGCNIWASLDGTSYALIGRQVGKSTMGVTTADWPVGNDPETVNVLAVDLTESLGTLVSSSASAEDSFTDLSIVGNSVVGSGAEVGGGCSVFELMSFGAVTMTAANQYNLLAGGGNHLRRGLYGTAIVDHPSGCPWAQLAGAIISKLELDQSWLGKVVHFKFTSFNLLQQMEQSLADVTDYTITLAACGLSYTLVPNPVLSQTGNIFLNDVAGNTWQLQIDDLGVLSATQVMAQSPPLEQVNTAAFTGNSWQLGIDPSGRLTVTSITYNSALPTFLTLQSATLTWSIAVDSSGVVSATSGGTSDFSRIAIAPFHAVFSFGSLNYLGTTIDTGTLVGAMPLQFWITVADSALVGETPGAPLQYFADTNQTRRNMAGYLYLGSITLVAPGGAVGTLGGSGQP